MSAAYVPPKDFYTNVRGAPSPANDPIFPGTGGVKDVPAPSALKKLGDILDASIVRVERRCSGVEKPISLPWHVLEEHFGGGLWPGLHLLNSGTGVGKTQWALQVGVNASKAATPVLYIGLELGELDLALRLLGGEADVPWSALWTGKASADCVRRAREAAPRLKDLPFHVEVAKPQGFSVTELRTAVEGFRKLYPETDGAGSRPLLVVVDFLQIIGDEPGSDQEVRIRIGRASYAMRDFANRLNISVLGISSIARERYSMLGQIQEVAGLTWVETPDGSPIQRRVNTPDACVGIGKESGELEYSADSVSLIAKVQGTWHEGSGCDVVFVTAKGRATGAMWSPLHFTGWAYETCVDDGMAVIQAWKSGGEAKAKKSEERKALKASARESARAAKIEADAAAVREYVRRHPGCSVREARVHAVGDSSSRWAAAVALLGDELVQATVTTKTGIRVALTISNIQARTTTQTPGGVAPPDTTASVVATAGVGDPAHVATKAEANSVFSDEYDSIVAAQVETNGAVATREGPLRDLV